MVYISIFNNILIDKIFDILYVKGPQGEECNLMSLKLSDRKKILKRIVTPEKNLLEIVEGHETTNLADIQIHFEAAIERNEEGIIIKQADSVYVARERSTTWLKMKADYMEGVYDTLDLAIIGAYYGEGYSKIGVKYHLKPNFNK
jgi:ATP-dependent DNA ligase